MIDSRGIRFAAGITTSALAIVLVTASPWLLAAVGSGQGGELYRVRARRTTQSTFHTHGRTTTPTATTTEVNS